MNRFKKANSDKKKKRGSSSDEEIYDRISKTLKHGTDSRPTSSDKPPLPKMSTLEVQRDEEDEKLAKAESKSSASRSTKSSKSSPANNKTRGNQWSDDEIMLILLGLFNGMTADEIFNQWPHNEYSRSKAALKQKILTIQKGMYDMHQGLKDDNPESNGKNAMKLIAPVLYPCKDDPELAIFGYPVAEFAMCLVALPKEKPIISIRFKIQRHACEALDAYAVVPSLPLVATFPIPKGYEFVRKLDVSANITDPTSDFKGVLLKQMLDEFADDAEEEEDFS